MCYEDKVSSVADSIASLLAFDNAEEAGKYEKSYLLQDSDALSLQIRETAEYVIANAIRLGLAHLLDGEHAAHRTLISTVEEAIRLCATRYRERSASQIPALV